MKGYIKAVEEWELSFDCGECGSDFEEFIYEFTASNGEVWKCKTCNTETVVNEQPREDDF